MYYSVASLVKNITVFCLHSWNASPVLTDSGSFVFNDDEKAEVFNS